jgi:hypothetical protein
MYAKEKPIDPPAIHADVNAKKEEGKTNKTTGGDSIRFVSGTITDLVSRQPVPGATIIVEGGRLAVTADVNGIFKLFIPDHVISDTVKLTITATDYVSKTMVCAVGDFPKNISIELYTHSNVMLQLRGKAGGVVYRKQPVWRKVKWWFWKKDQ